MMAVRIALGTAQFGLDYGVTNRAGQIPEDVARVVLTRARALGVRWIDTAAAYGTAEAVIGRLVGADGAFRICTKVVSSLQSGAAVELAEWQFRRALERLARPRVDVLMIHEPRRLLEADGAALYGWLAAQKERGTAAAIGASVYDAAQARALTDRYRLDWIQLPLNVFDQRCLRDGTLVQLKSRGVSVQARSVLLQGLLLADPNDLPKAFAAARAPLLRVREAAAASGVSPLALALGFVASVAEVDQIVLGVETPEQLDECASALGTAADPHWRELACDDPAVIDPRRWPSGVRIGSLRARQ
jgi:aryl-alcohol dehydrogenase-like predicted oxidoreductase